MSDRRAPSAGYGFREKEGYRHEVWRAFADMWGEQLADQRAMILPSKEGLEIPVALRWGASESNLVGVDENRALIATARWRGAYPAVRGMGNTIGRAAERLAAEEARFGVVNLDLCNKFSRSMVDELQQFAAADILADTAVVAVTLLKGREHPETTAALSIMAERCGLEWNMDAARPFLAMLFMEEALAGRAWCPIKSGEYRSGSKNMVWLVAATATHEAMRAEARARGWAETERVGTERDRYAYHGAWEYFRYRDRGRWAQGPLPRWGLVREGPTGWEWTARDHPRCPHYLDDDDLDLQARLREHFSSAAAAVEYFDGEWDSDGEWREGAWGEAMRKIKRRWEAACEAAARAAAPALPWCDRWRNAPHLEPCRVDLGAVRFTTADPPRRGPVTQPFNTWKINRPAGDVEGRARVAA